MAGTQLITTIEQLENADAHDQMKPGQVAKLFRVDPKTVARWERNGKLPSSRTPGNHRRFEVGIVRLVMEDIRAKDKSKSEVRDDAPTNDSDPLLMPSEAAALLQRHPQTVARWCDEGRLSYVRGPGGHRRIRTSSVKARLLDLEAGE